MYDIYDIYDILMPSDLNEVSTMYLVGQPVKHWPVCHLLDYVLENLNEWTDIYHCIFKNHGNWLKGSVILLIFESIFFEKR